ncbi:MAG: hypothetical protein ABSC92_09950 [Rhizomicrobium sp.]|jgi:hypothetical protein
MLRAFPLLAIMIILYALLTFGGGMFAHHDMHTFMDREILNIGLISTDRWSFKVGDLFLLISLVLLFVEVVKATRTTTKELINHGLAMLTFVVALILFITVKGFATSTFFLMTVMSLFDVIAGYTISVVAAEHDLGMGRAGTD